MNPKSKLNEIVGISITLLAVFIISFALPQLSSAINPPGTTIALRLGSKNVLVAALQKVLIQKGYLTSAATGSFDTNTRSAVKAFQTATHQRATGVIYMKKSKLASSFAAVATPFAQIRAGAPVEQVRDVQEFLNTAGYNAGTPDGIFDTQTQTAVKAYQLAKAISQTGVVDIKTFGAMNGDTVTVPVTVTGTAGAGGTISPSSRLVTYGTATTFTITPSAGYSASVSGCGGVFVGATYTTDPIINLCAVTATFTPVPVNGACATTHYNCSKGTTANNSESIGNTKWTWNCNGINGGTNASCTQAIPPPTNLSGSCAASGASATLSWTLPSGYTLSYFRITDNGAAMVPYYIPDPAADTGPHTSITTTPGHTYSWWVHTRLPSGAYSVEKYGGFTCANNNYTITATAKTGGTITPASALVHYGSTAVFTVTPNAGYKAAVTGCGGSLSGTTYTTGVIKSNCTITPTYSLNTFTVTGTAGTGGTISPTSKIVNNGSSTTFTVAPKAGYVTAGATGCGGALVGTTYKTAPITGACAVSATFATGPVNGVCATTHYSCSKGTSANNKEVVGVTSWTWNCNGANGGTNASCSQAIPLPASLVGSCPTSGTATMSWALPSGYTLSYFRIKDNTTGATLNASWIPEGKPDTGHSTSIAGMTPGHNYTWWVHTRLPSGAYSVEKTASFTCAGSTPSSYIVTATAGVGGTITPSSKSVTSGMTTSFTVTPSAGYSIAGVSGCGGALPNASNIYTTGAITSACTVAATFIGTVNDSYCNSVTTPRSVTRGQAFAATVVMTNMGTKVWKTIDPTISHRLGDPSPLYPPNYAFRWTLGRVSLPSTPINPGSSATFSFNPVAPLGAGDYDFTWQMVEEGREWFGATCTKTVTVY